MSVRLFVAVWPDEAARSALEGVLRGAQAGVRWSRPAQWHVTLAFLGAVVEDGVPAVTAALRGLEGTGPARGRLGPATTLLTPRVLCAPVHGLERLASGVRSQLAAAGITFDRRPFRGHCTLARAPRGGLVPPALVGTPVHAEWTARRVDVVASEPQGAGSAYRVLSWMALGAPEAIPPANTCSG